ncbi:GRF zinc finger containing protein [Striga asiatica]|uniref:GRF zinc finger containing protein n=1 Tax=Striga asiatica TaxID=4170 RepID=A0A5A7NXZ8_STRAF|nr:GRF zinc finger containing protein [Striga asiatica]GER28820.1 GRF zinc finger containing protein [Striga asiatica]
MSSSSSSMRETRVLCLCGKYARMTTSWTSANPGRRYLHCEEKACTFWKWFDPPMCARSKEIIPGLLTKINRLEDETNRQHESATTLEANEKKMKKVKKLEKENSQLKKKNNILVLLVVITWLVLMFKK